MGKQPGVPVWGDQSEPIAAVPLWIVP